MFTIMDLDKNERFSTVDFETKDQAERELNRLNINYGKEFALGVAEIVEDNSGFGYHLTEV